MSTNFSAAQYARLASIDFHLYYYGTVTRRGHMERFVISSASASNDLSLYMDFLDPNTVTYHNQQRAYNATSLFKPLYQHPPRELIQCMLVHGNELMRVLHANSGTPAYRMNR